MNIKKQFIKKTTKIGIALSVSLVIMSWGYTGHYKINTNASLSFNEQMNQFNAWTSILASHASDADERKQYDPTEGPKHYIDIDNYTEFVSNGSIPQTFDSVISIHGSTFVYGQGILPWATKAAFDSLKSCFVRRDWDKAVLFASDLGHYVADGHMPMHITRNYNGQYTGNDGIHSRYESTMINSFNAEIVYSGMQIDTIADVNQYIFNYLYNNYIYVDSVIGADNYAKSINSNTYSTEYKRALWDYSKDFTILLFKNASHALTELIYTAWIQAGSPSMDETNIEKPTHENKLISLEPVYPNPFSGSTQIKFSVSKQTEVFVQVKDISGKTVDTLLTETKPVGEYNIIWNPGNLPQGVYFLILKSDYNVIVEKMILYE
ncbi:MAG: T9SS type A sorting domain-containing protein [Chlorobi bacterium]|nr:T9SS type A sorting domain-containing protein [Chlorobiota bacterium]